MKKHYFEMMSFAVIAATLGSCKLEERSTVLKGEVDFSISASVPKAICTYSSGDGGAANVDFQDFDQRYILEVYDGRDVVYRDVNTVEIGSPASFNVRLLAKEYTFAFWADFVPNGSESDNLYNTANGLDEVTVKENRNAGKEIADAYCNSMIVNLSESGLTEKNINLQRPFGKIRLVSTDIPENADAVEPSESIVTYVSGIDVPSGYNVVAKEALGTTVEAGSYQFVPYKEAVSVGGVNKGELYVLGIDYIFASVSHPVYSFDVQVDGNGARRVTNIPVSANKLTTVIGNFYTNEGTLEVIVDSEFDGNENGMQLPDPVAVSSYDELMDAFNEGYDVVLVSDVTVPENSMLSLAAGKEMNLDLGGKKIVSGNSQNSTFSSMFDIRGTLNVSNGTIDYSYTGENMGWNGGVAVFYVTSGGVLNMESVILNDLGGTDMSFTVHLNNYGNVTLNAENCEFNSPYCGVRIFNSGPDMNKVSIKNSKLTGASRTFWVHNYIGDFSGSADHSDDKVKARLDIDIFGNGNEFVTTSDGVLAPIRYGFSAPVYFTENGMQIRKPVINDVEHTAIIADASELHGFAAMVNAGTTFNGYTVSLNCDIDLNNEPWTPIGNGTHDFEGTFDGKNHTIRNLAIRNRVASENGGFFGSIDGTAKNFTIEGADIRHIVDGYDGGVAVVAGYLKSNCIIENVTVRNAVVEANRWTGGIGGYVHGAINGCMVENISITVTPDRLLGNYDNGDKAGGIVGYIVKNGPAKIEGCSVSNATIKGYRDLGGIAGCANSRTGYVVSINNCNVSGLNIIQDFANGYKDKCKDVETLGSVYGRGYTSESDSNTAENVSILVKVYDTESAQLALDAAKSARTIELSSGTYGPIDVRQSASTSEILDYTGHPDYKRTIKDLTVKAAAGASVSVEGVKFAAGHVYDGSYNAVTGTEVIAGQNAFYSYYDISNLTFEGFDMTSAFYIGSDSNTEDTPFMVLDGLHIKSCRMTGTVNTMNDNSHRLVRIGNGSRRLKNITVTDCTADNIFHGVMAYGAVDITVERCRFNNLGHNVLQVGSGKVLFCNNTIENCSADRLFRVSTNVFQTEDWLKIMDNTVLNSTGDASDSSYPYFKSQDISMYERLVFTGNTMDGKVWNEVNVKP